VRSLDRFRLSPLYGVVRPLTQRLEVPLWRLKGSPAPIPHLLKQRIVREYGRRFARDTLVETGTYLGTMVLTARRAFRKIYSIELDPDLFERSHRKFAGNPGIDLRFGDSAAVLPPLLEELSSADVRAVFWLDAHFSGGLTARGALETPVRRELQLILERARDPVLLIDDAHLFTGQRDYPTLDELRAAVRATHPAYAVDVDLDIVRIHPLEAPSTAC
jgi:hypothetical protein